MNWLLQTINKIGKPLDQLSKRKKKNKEEMKEGKGRREERAKLTESEINRNT